MNKEFNKGLLMVIVLFGLAAWLCSGCAQVKFNPDTKDFEYTRIGDQTIEGLDIVLADGTGIGLNKQSSQTAETLSEVVELIKLLAPVIATP